MKTSVITVLFVIGAIWLGSSGCYKENPEPSYKTFPIVDSSFIAYIFNQEVYISKMNGTETKQLTTDGGAKRQVAIRPDQKMIAFINSDNNPVIVDTSGNIIAVLTSYTGAGKPRWANNDTTLYFVYNGNLTFYGPTFTYPSMIGLPLGANLEEVCISDDGNYIAYVYNTGGSWGNHYFNWASSTGNSGTEIYDNGNGNSFLNLQWSTKRKELYYDDEDEINLNPKVWEIEWNFHNPIANDYNEYLTTEYAVNSAGTHMIYRATGFSSSNDFIQIMNLDSIDSKYLEVIKESDGCSCAIYVDW